MGKNKLISDVPIEKMSREADSVEVIFVKDGSNIMSYIGRLRKKIGLEAGKNPRNISFCGGKKKSRFGSLAK